MRRLILISVSILGFVVTVTIPLMAQGGFGNQNEIASVRSQLETTDQKIERAREVVQATDAAAARKALEAAIYLQTMAWKNFRYGSVIATTVRLTIRAREEANKAISAGRQTEQNQNAVLRRLERATQMLERAREAIASDPDRAPEAILESARDYLDRAWEFYRLRKLRPALKLADLVEKAARKMLKAADHSSRTQGRFERHADMVSRSIDIAGVKVSECGSETALQQLEQARNAYRQAMDLSSQQKHDLALQALRNARELADQAARECRGDQLLKNRYSRCKREADRLSGMIELADDHGAHLRKQVYEQLRLVEDYLDAGETRSATAALRAAELTLRQLKKHLRSSGL